MDELPDLDDAAVLWSVPDSERAGRPLLVLLHGYGADEHDLFGLAPHLPPEFVLAAVRAPLAPPWPSPGYSWYPIGGASENGGSGAGPRTTLDGRDPDAVTDAASAVLAWVDRAAIGAESVGMLGFSQGAAVAIQALRLAPERFAFVINLSGYASPGLLAGDAQLATRKPPVFWGRGTRDEVIPEFLVEHTVQWLPGHADLSGRVYPGLTHSVSEQELADVRVFLEKVQGDVTG
ncbi:alpha/beta hydrolase [Microbacterium sp. P02]|uniref:alpha/beta hydrolase n=1 Tax=Microbacterium sp. P02 TaxID=3366260 RepID=UPI0036720BBF